MTSFFENQISALERAEHQLARVTEENRGAFRIAANGHEYFAEITGKLRHQASDRAALPAVGDWVMATLRDAEGKALIHRVLERKSKFSRKAVGGTTSEQIIAANIDVALIVTSLNRELNPNRLERYLALVWDSGARPVIVLTKADLCPDPLAMITALERRFAHVSILVTSVVDGRGGEELRALLAPGLTLALVGSSGVGKSSLINFLASAEKLEVGEIRRSDDRGRHTTTRRQLLELPCGAFLIDTPGMRELQLWDAGDGLDAAFDGVFEDLGELARSCRFADCSHSSEPGCAVTAALASGEIDEERVLSWIKLVRESEYLARKQSQRLARETKRRWKQLTVAGRERSRWERRDW